MKEFESVPEGAIVLGEVEASRCHRRTNASPPTEKTLLLDLKVSAYINGADGISDIRVNKGSGLIQNCWYILDGKATMFSLPR